MDYSGALAVVFTLTVVIGQFIQAVDRIFRGLERRRRR
jgi:hypothetical protein